MLWFRRAESSYVARISERVLRFDTILAICALLISTVTAGAMVYQTRVLADQTHLLEQQFVASNWPYLRVENDRTASSFKISVTNDGAGPALIRSAQLLLDNKHVRSWSPLLEAAIRETAVHGQRESFQIDSVSIDASNTIRPGDTRTLIGVEHAPSRVIDAIRSHRVTLNFCYCALSGQCWTLSESARSIPQPAHACTIDSGIDPENIK